MIDSSADRNRKVSTPVNWQQGENVIIAGSVSDDEAKETFGEWESRSRTSGSSRSRRTMAVVGS